MSKTFGDLVKEIKGKRTLKEMEQDTGIDASVISKMIRNVYTPQKEDVFKVLISPKSHPQADIKLEELIAVAKIHKKNQSDIEKGVEAAKKVLEAIGDVYVHSILPTGINTIFPLASMPVTKPIVGTAAKVKKGAKTEESLSEGFKQYMTITNGILYGLLAQKSISFVPVNKEDNPYKVVGTSTLIRVTNNNIEECLIKYIYFKGYSSEAEAIIKNSVKGTLEKLLFLPQNSRRKTAIVVNHEEVYKELIKYKEQISLKGILSVVLLNEEKFILEKEDYISFYNDSNEEYLRFV